MGCGGSKDDGLEALTLGRGYLTGCGGSKVDGLEATALCRGRTGHLSAAIGHRYALAASHAAYADSLRSVGDSLHRVLLLDAAANAAPILSLPTQRKDDSLPVPSPSPPAKLGGSAKQADSPSHSGSHIDFHALDSDSDDESPLHSAGASPVNPAAMRSNIHYARSKPPPYSVSFEQPVQRAGAVKFFDPNSPVNDSSDHSTSNAPAASDTGYYGYGGMDGYYGSPFLPSMAAAATASSSSAAPAASPPPPSPPKTSGWEFLDPFEAYQSYYPPSQPYTPSRRSREVREEEGIPDLEEDEHEVIKEAYEDPEFMKKFAASTTRPNPEEHRNKVPPPPSKDGKGGGHQSRCVVEDSSSDDEAGVVEKNVAHEERKSVAAPVDPPRSSQDVSGLAGEIRATFDRASECAMDFSRLLEVGKQPYRRRSSVYEASSRIVHGMTSPSCSESVNTLGFKDDSVISSRRRLSSTLQKLYIWEKKLHDEVRAEEKMRILHDKNCKRLRHLDDSDAEAKKIDATRAQVRNLSMNIGIALRVVDSMSSKISTLRDEELWPQIIELIQGLLRMWKVMLECHRSQHQAISQVTCLDHISSGGKLNDSDMDVVVELQLGLLRWIGNLSDWIIAQKNFVKALNGWLILCLNYEPEVTADGIPPYSPGKLGAPPIFILCNYWSQEMDQISEGEVVEATQAFAANVCRLWEQHAVEQHQKLIADRDDKFLKTQERKAQTIHKELGALNKKLALRTGNNSLPLHGGVGHQGQAPEQSSLQLGLKQIFEAMDDFTCRTLRAYEKLQLHSEEERLRRENTNVS